MVILQNYILVIDLISVVVFRLQETRTSLREADKASREVGAKLQDVQLSRSTAESELAIEKQWRSSLQVTEAKDNII